MTGSAVGRTGEARQAFAIDPVEPYSKVIKAGGLVFVKSQIGPDASGKYPESVSEQTRNTLEHLEHALAMTGSSMSDVLKINVYLARVEADFDGMHEAFAAFFAERGLRELPARTAIGARLSWPQLLVQMDLVAVEA